jgi:hypothetical protein
MLPGITKVSPLLIFIFLASPSLGSEPPTRESETSPVGPGETSEQPAPSTAHGTVILDYETIPIAGFGSIDLMGLHLYKRFNNWLYLGVGGHAPLISGDYGGFMVFDASVLVQQRLFWNMFADAGASWGGGGGGKNVAQSRIISGTGGFKKAYVGLGYDFNILSAGLNLSNVKLAGSAIHSSQLDLYIQVPFTFEVGPYASYGHSLPDMQESSREEDNGNKSKGNSLEFGLNNIIQLKPEGTYKNTINLLDVQFNHYLTDRSYLFVEGGAGYRGLVLYNQVLGGVGYKYPYSHTVNISGQFSVGSGGYDPEKINTGPGLLLYPKVAAEYLLNNYLGISLSSGYLYAPKGSSKNLTLGASITYHDSAQARSQSDVDATQNAIYRGFRFSLFEQSEFHTNVGEKTEGTLKLASTQIDTIISRRFYVPLQYSIAYNAYDGNPGYGEILAGVGVQTEHSPQDRFQAFAQLLAGTNATSILAKPGAGVNFGLTDELAIYGQVDATLSLINRSQRPNQKIRAPTAGLGLTYRFSLPSR